MERMGQKIYRHDLEPRNVAHRSQREPEEDEHQEHGGGTESLSTQHGREENQGRKAPKDDQERLPVKSRMERRLPFPDIRADELQAGDLRNVAEELNAIGIDETRADHAEPGEGQPPDTPPKHLKIGFFSCPFPFPQTVTNLARSKEDRKRQIHQE